MEDNITLQQAMIFFERAYRSQMKGDFARAIELYEKSLNIVPTPEAHTYLGWTYSMMSRYEEAISHCLQAIELDPEFGNPYNDIGTYLLELGKPEEAIAWLEKATQAGRYETPQFPYFNLGRAYERLGLSRSALAAYDHALRLAPTFQLARWAKMALLSRLN
jgi:tetratricopeptide (TPR) repeat protein